jgi:hypothetical protein
VKTGVSSNLMLRAWPTEVSVSVMETPGTDGQDLPLARFPSKELIASRASRGDEYSNLTIPVDLPERSYWSGAKSV